MAMTTIDTANTDGQPATRMDNMMTTVMVSEEAVVCALRGSTNVLSNFIGYLV